MVSIRQARAEGVSSSESLRSTEDASKISIDGDPDNSSVGASAGSRRRKRCGIIGRGVEVVGTSTAAKFVACLLYCRCSEHGHRPGFATLACKTDEFN